MIDHTLLKPDATRQNIEDLCREAAQFKFATVCVNPTWVATCTRLLQGSGVLVCSVVGFPLGATTADAATISLTANGTAVSFSPMRSSLATNASTLNPTFSLSLGT
jgi:deoxyribose-phosphate aldolase